MKQYCLKFHAVGEWLCVNQLECLHAMCSAISLELHGMFQQIAAAVLETFVMKNKDGAVHPATCCLSFLQTLKEYELIMLI